MIPNYLIDEPAETWEKKLESTVPPTMFVIGREGKRAKRFTTDVDAVYV